MADLFYLQDSRSNVGSRAMFWKQGGGYTSNLDQAEQFTREKAVKRYQCRENDLPWPVGYIRAMAEVGVDHQYLDQRPEQALAAASADDRIYVAYKQVWDGNCLMWRRAWTPGVGTSNLADANTWSIAQAPECSEQGYVPWPKSYIDRHSRPVVQACKLDHKQALREVGLKLPRIKRQRIRRYTFNCDGCGRFLSELQRYHSCPNCGVGNAL